MRIVTTGIVLLAGTATVRADDSSEVAISIVLDCSASMDQPIKSDLAGAGEVSRMQVAKQIVETALESFAQQGDHHIGLWLLGHRLAWEDAERPGLMEQTDYLAQTNGFAVLKNLVPGDDVELVRHVRSLRDDHMPLLAPQLQAVTAWGESPVYLAVSRAIDEFGIQSRLDAKGIIVLTDGGNETYMPRQPRTLDDVLRIHYRKHIPVRIIGIDLNTEDHAQAIKEYREIARRTGGSFRQVDTAKGMINAFADDVQAIGNPQVETETVVQTDAKPGVVAKPAARTNAPAAKSEIAGVVLFNGAPVKNALVKLTGPVIRSVKTDREGKFTFPNLPVGEYDVSAEGIARNKIRSYTIDVTVEAPPKSPPYVEAVLE
ncbi:MAG TPA: carboxypeptidase regulatory-like domain-containing protein [Pirellulales bacterium]|nr:carboxypeptidase regulatory-like domain-containing protein [Pirellulales bacterium]